MMTKYLVSFYNDQDAFLEAVAVETESSDIKYIKKLAKNESRYHIDKDCKITIFDDDIQEYIN